MTERRIGESGLISPIESLASDLNKYGLHCIGIPLGGTFGMIQDPRSKEWVSKLPGAFDSETLAKFNNREIDYDPVHLFLDMVELPPPDIAIYAKLLSENNGNSMTPWELQDANSQDLINTMNLYRRYLYPHTLKKGAHELESLAADCLGAYHYSDLLVHELSSGRYERGVRLDSSELVDERSMAVFSAVNCAVVFPQIYEAAKNFVGEITITEKGIAREDVTKLEDAFQNMVVLISIGSDQKKVASSFYDIVGYKSGLTFVIVSSNSSYGVEGGDAETNLCNIPTVVQAINEGKLPRGTAYDVGDGLVSTNLVEKIKPGASDLQQAVNAPDGKYYAATFLAHHSIPISQIENLKNWFFNQSNPDIPSLPLCLAHIPNPSDPNYIDPNKATRASQLMEVFNSVQKLNIDNIVPDKFPQGTRFITIEAPGKANGPQFILRSIKKSVGQLEARTNNKTLPVFIVTSESPFPNVTDEYGASVISGLKRYRGYKDRVVNGRSLNAYTIRNLVTLLLIKAKVNSDFGILDAESEYFGVGAANIQNWIDDYVTARALHSVDNV